ncbi:DNA recombination protein RmuC [Pontimicrobium sp. MEBiC06410]
MEAQYIYLIVGLIIGAVIAYLWLKQKFSAQNATLKAQTNHAQEEQTSLQNEVNSLNEENNSLKNDISNFKTTIAEKKVALDGLEKDLNKLQLQFNKLEEGFNAKTESYNALNSQLATANADNKSLNEKLVSQKEEMDAMGKKFNAEFKNIASEILKDNTKSFSEVNEAKINELLKPLNKDIAAFKTKVEEVYDKEAKERFSLGEKVKELAEKSDKISQDAINLTNALKGEVKTQGRWGEMILENILEISGLAKGQEYFMEHQLFGPDGKALRSEVEGKKMRPDALIKYPDERNVIIDSKVSLNAFTRYFEATTPEQQTEALEEHVKAIKNHIIGLSAKGYDDYDKALDFVMMFIPSEPAYIAAMQSDPNLWNYAYDKRILLMNPTNLITALKLIVDLWKREYQNQNAIEIAGRGEKLYKKFVGFVENMEKVGDNIDRAKSAYDDAYGQLSTGRDNLVTQATKLKELGNFQPKKDINQTLIDSAQQNGQE